jgi:hypothetical protein
VSPESLVECRFVKPMADRPQNPTEIDEETRRQWIEEFEAAARRPLKQRFRYAFIKTYKPVMDDAPFRAFDTTADYRRWCEENLPSWLGYGRV